MTVTTMEAWTKLTIEKRARFFDRVAVFGFGLISKQCSKKVSKHEFVQHLCSTLWTKQATLSKI